MSYHIYIIAYNIISCIIITYNTISRIIPYIISHHIISYQQYHTIYHHVISYHITSYHISYHIISYRIIYRILYNMYHIISYIYTISRHISYHIYRMKSCTKEHYFVQVLRIRSLRSLKDDRLFTRTEHETFVGWTILTGQTELLGQNFVPVQLSPPKQFHVYWSRIEPANPRWHGQLATYARISRDTYLSIKYVPHRNTPLLAWFQTSTPK